jgi:hypothetical protein
VTIDTIGLSPSHWLPTTVGRLRKTCWPSRSYQRDAWEPLRVDGALRTKFAIQLIARLAGADSLGLQPADYDAEWLGRLARGFLTERRPLAAG